MGLTRAGAFCFLAAMIIWAGYRFDIGTVTPAGHHYVSLFKMGRESSAHRLLARAVEHRVLPAPKFWQGWIDVLSHNQEGHSAYLLGKTSMQGWWYYFPVAVAVKTTLPLLVMIAISVWQMARRPAGASRAGLYPVWGIVAVLATSMAGNLNIGVRHVLPIYPFFAILGSSLFAESHAPRRFRRASRAALLGLLAWHVIESLAAHPDYLAYFN